MNKTEEDCNKSINIICLDIANIIITGGDSGKAKPRYKCSLYSSERVGEK